jgi:hypothetical protein
MEENRTEFLQTVVEPSLAVAIRAEASRRGHSVSSWLRYIARQHVDADALTLEQCGETEEDQ